MENFISGIKDKIADEAAMVSLVKHATIDAQDEIRTIAKEQLADNIEEVYARPHTEWAERTRRYEQGLFAVNIKGRATPDKEYYHMNTDVSHPDMVTFTLYGKVPKQNPWRFGGNLIEWIETGKYQGAGNGQDEIPNTGGRKKLDGKPIPFMSNTDKDLDTIRKEDLEAAIMKHVEEELSALESSVAKGLGV